MTLESATRSQAAEAMLKQLKNPFDPKYVKYRVGATNKDKTKGIALFYVDAREVMKRLDEVCGIDGWATKKEETPHGVMCALSIRMPYSHDGREFWVTKSDFGEFSKASEIKGASSDALKRAAVNFGIGRYLYYIPNRWYPLDKYKNFVEQPVLPSWALPSKDLENWEDLAEMEYDASNDVGLDGVIFSDEEAQEELTNRVHTRQELLDALKKKNA